ncbi:MAG: stage III sporulation protein AB [Lachnospiraceae bacterium]|nr:stage III sporulation protein AB [Lachnospiraceae bacterium]
MLKVIGAVCVIGAAGLMGYTKSRSLHMHIQQLKTLRKICMEIIGELTVGRIPLYEILLRISGKCEPPFCDFLLAVCEQMQAYDGSPFADIFSLQTDRKLSGVLTPEECEEWKKAGTFLTISDQKVQVGLMRLYERELEGNIELLERGKREKQRLYQTLGLMGGILLTILLL